MVTCVRPVYQAVQLIIFLPWLQSLWTCRFAVRPVVKWWHRTITDEITHEDSIGLALASDLSYYDLWTYLWTEVLVKEDLLHILKQKKLKLLEHSINYGIFHGIIELFKQSSVTNTRLLRTKIDKLYDPLLKTVTDLP